jgi:hypothetical protein
VKKKGKNNVTEKLPKIEASWDNTPQKTFY